MFRGPGIRSLCKFSLDIVLPSMLKLLEALEKWQGSQDPKHTAFNLAFGGTGLMDRFPDEACFRAIMSAADAKGLSSYPLWKEIDQPDSVFVDVGGNHGYGSLAIAKSTQHLKFIVQDMESVISKAEEQEKQPGGVLVDETAGNRLTLQPYDIFGGPQPVKNADVYFFRAIFQYVKTSFPCTTIAITDYVMQQLVRREMHRNPAQPASRPEARCPRRHVRHRPAQEM